jgi:hypothetical protein
MFITCSSIWMGPPSPFIFDTNGFPLFCGNGSLDHAILGWVEKEGREVIPPMYLLSPPSDEVAIVFILLLYTL